MTADEHFTKGEQLLTQAEEVCGYPAQAAALAQRAHAHFAAAQYLRTTEGDQR